MKKNLLILLLAILFLSPSLWAQTTSLYDFEASAVGATSFVSNSQTFTVTSQSHGPFSVANLTSAGWNGTAADNQYLDNTGHDVANTGAGFTIGTSGAVAFNINSCWMYFANGSNENVPVSAGTLTITGKLGGVTKFTVSSSTGFNSNIAVTNGFALIDFTTFGGSGTHANIPIDQLVFSTSANFDYIALDAFKWTTVVPLSATTGQTNLICNGVCNGSATVTPSGGSSPYTYSWAPSGGTGATASSLCAGNYTCTITDAVSTVITKAFTITQPTAITVTPISQTNVACNGGSNGAAMISASGGTGVLTYNWNPGNPTGDGTNSVTGLTAGTWSCTVTDANSCTHTSAVFNVTQPTALSATTTQTNVACNGGSNGKASVSVSGGTAGYTYSWAPSGGTGATASGLTSGNYTCTITDANSCTLTKAFTITQPSALSATTTQTNVACNGGSNGIASVNVSGGTTAYAYSWSPSGGTGSTASGLTSGNYTCTITDAHSCTLTKAFTITAPAALSAAATQTNVACFGNASGAANVNVSGGTTAYAYSWSPSGGTAATASNLVSGNYTCTITDANSCSITKAFTITQPASGISATTTQTNVACNGGSNAIAAVNASGGTGSLSYSWSPSGGTSAIASGLSVGNYTCTISDASTCSSIKTFTVTQPTALLASTTQTNVACNGGSNGIASVNVSGGTTTYAYSWSPSGGTGATASGLTATNYTCTITDANSCTLTKAFTITAPAALSASTTQTNVACNGGSNGIASVNVSGGTTTYAYSWSPSGGTGATASGLTATNYTCTITDANSCSIAKTFTVTQPVALSASTTQTNVACNGGSNAVASVSASGGIGSLSYSWSPSGGTSATASGLTQGNYTCSITDANSCSISTTFTITQPTLLTATATSGTIACNGGVTTITVSATGGTTSYTGTGTYTATAGSYTYTVNDANSCSAIATITINEPSLLQINVSTGTISCNGMATTAIVSASGGTPSYTGTGTYTVTAGSYTYTVSDANSCSTSATVTVNQPNAITSSQSPTVCAGGSVTVGTHTYTTTGTYTDVLPAINGCDSTVTTNLTVNNAINNSVSAIGATITANATGATYQWIDCNNANAPIAGATNQSYTALSTGNYAVIITEASCSNTSTCTPITTTGIAKINADNNLLVYPNPFDNQLTIVSNAKTKAILYNIVGEKVTEFTIENQTQTINLGELAPGIYYLQVDNKKVKIIKQ